MSQIKQPESLQQQAMRAIRSYISSEHLVVGENLPSEGYFAETLGVSRAVIREAFGALAALNILDVGNGRKARVAAIDGGVISIALAHALSTQQLTVADVWDVRRTLELHIVGLAATKRSDEDSDRLIRLARGMRESVNNPAQMTDYDIEFHQCIATACQNPLFTAMIQAVHPLMRVAVPAAWQTRTEPDQRERILEQHLAIAEAIAKRDSLAAVGAMSAHFDTTIGEILKDQHMLI